MSAGGHVLRNRTNIRAGVNLNNLIVPGVYAVDDPTNGPAAGNFLVEVYVALITADRIIAQRAIGIDDGSTNMRIYDGSTWGSWAEIAGGGSPGGSSGGTRVRVATTAAITIATALNSGDSLDGETLADGDLVLVKDQADQTTNGIYEVGAIPALADGYDAYADYPGILVQVEEGTSNADTLWLCTSDTDGTNITFVERAMVMDTDTALAANSDRKIATQKAVKAYVDAVDAEAAAAQADATQALADAAAAQADADAAQTDADAAQTDADAAQFAVDNYAHPITRVRVVATGAVTIADDLNNGDSLDGVTLATGDLVLLTAQGSTAANGIYEVGASPARHARYTTFDSLLGILVIAQAGNTNRWKVWQCISAAGGTIGVSGQTWLNPFVHVPGTRANLSNPAGDRIIFFDDSIDEWAFLTLAGGAAIDTTTLRIHESILIAIGDETTEITSGTGKVTFRMPYAFTLTGIRGSLGVASTSGVVTVDVNEAGSTILSTKLTIDQDEKTSTTAAAAAVISDTALADDAEITIDIDGAGVDAVGLKVTLLGYRP